MGILDPRKLNTVNMNNNKFHTKISQIMVTVYTCKIIIRILLTEIITISYQIILFIVSYTYVRMYLQLPGTETTYK